MRVELGSPAGEVDGVGIATVEGGETRINRFAAHDLTPTVGPAST